MNNSAIALVGMVCRFPGARNISEFWRNLRDGIESIRPLSDAELLAAGVAPEMLSRPEYVKAAAVLDGVDLFDAAFFGLSPRDAAIMDPQHRHFLECAWEALEDAGHPPEQFDGSIGVFAGSGMNAYMIHNLLRNHRLLESAGPFLIRQTGNDKDVLATRVSYQLDLHGPSLAVQTACSSSLVAVHLACQSLLGCECDMALAGGVTIEIPHAQGYLYREGEILSRDGQCRAFDAASSGTVFSSGVGIVVLRRLADALRDHDTIHAVILGTAVNNDGQRKVGYLAPSVAGQAEVIAEALGVAGVKADTISYVEAHGTGTTVGDPIEIKALTQAFRQDTDRNGFCGIGSLKTNVGHLDTAAGVAGLIKTALALRHRQLPPSLHFHRANPQIDFANSPFYVNASLAEWNGNAAPRRAGVTSLGIGGTNAHVVLEEAPDQVRPATARPYQLLTLSAKTEKALEEAAARLADHLRQNPELRLADVAFTCQAGRKAFRHRRIVVAHNAAEAAEMLAAPEVRKGFTGSDVSPSAPSVVFLFPGQGSQYPNMAADLYANEPVFRSHLDRCAEQLLPHLGLDLRNILYPRAEDADSAARMLNRTSITQPALFSVEYALAQWWMAHGVRPQAMAGHSIGEYVAACLADVLSLADALAVTAVRGRLMDQCAPGSMLAVSLPQEALNSLPLPEGISVAAVNSPQQCVVSGPDSAVAELEQKLVQQGALCRKLQTSHAFHSAMMDPILEPFLAHVRRIALRPPKIPYLSNLTGTWISAAQAIDPEYWASHLRNTVRFSENAAELLRQSGRALIEVGPGRTLGSLVRQHVGDEAAAKSAVILPSLPRQEETVADTAFLLSALGQLWVNGQVIDWSALHAGEDVMRIPLPTYPFQRQRFWIDPDPASEEGRGARDEGRGKGDEGPGTRGEAREKELSSLAPRPLPLAPLPMDQWFSQRCWRRSTPSSSESLAPTSWLVFQDPLGLGKQITLRLRAASHKVVEVAPGNAFKQIGSQGYRIRPGVRADYDALLADLSRRELSPQRIVHLWNVRDESSQLSLDDKTDLSFYSLLFLAQALGEKGPQGIDIAVVSDRMQSVMGEPVLDPIAATSIGPTRVIPKELPGIACRSIDVNLASRSSAPLAIQIVTELSAPLTDSVVALRGEERWVESFEPCDLRAEPTPGRLRQKGVYLITGGLGGLGLVIAEELARTLQARLVLLGRTPLPPAQEWRNALATPGTPERVKQQIRKLIEIESLGAEILVLSGDLCQREAMKRAVKSAATRFGPLNGVIHAAGVLEDGPLQLKSRQSAARVLDPKVKGTLVLNDVLREVLDDVKPEWRLDFCALFSSVSSVLAPAGQVDYAAANAFLDAFAAGRREAGMFAINWGPWRDVGMAARTTAEHPLLGRRLLDTSDEIVYSVLLSQERHWLVSDHCLKGGRGVVPGTGYLEMASAACKQRTFEDGVAFEDVFFVAPLIVEPGQSREARVVLQKVDKNVFQFSIRGRDAGWTEHASGRIARCQAERPADCNLDPIAARCRTRVLTFDDTHRTEQEKYFAFGPRWRCLKILRLGDNEALAELELPNAFSEDLSVYRLHPALLDLATGSSLYLIENYGSSSAVYFPMAYKRVTLYRQLPLKFFSHIRSRQRNEAGSDVAVFEFTLLDEQGRVLGEIEGFTMRKVSDPRTMLASIQSHSSASPSRNGVVQDLPPRGIPPADGAKAFLRIVNSDAPPAIFVNPDGPPALNGPTGTMIRSIPRTPPLKDQIESVLSEWWREALGVEQVGRDDDFFELGGHSLLVVRLLARIEKEYKKAISLAEFFQSPTINSLARILRDTDKPKPKELSVIVPFNERGDRLPFYCVHALLGEVVSFRHLARILGSEQPFYGIQAPPEMTNADFAFSIENMARYYSEALLAFQPTGPLLLGGWSVGSTIALEMAQLLKAKGRDVELLIALDGAPYNTGAETGWWNPLLYGKLLRNVPYWVADDLLLNFSSRAFATRVRKKLCSLFENTVGRLRSGGKAPRDVDSFMDTSSLSRNQTEFMNALYNALLEYTPKPYQGQVLVYKARTQPILHLLEVERSWKKVSSQVEILVVPGNHLSIVFEPYINRIANDLRKRLSRFHRASI